MRLVELDEAEAAHRLAKLWGRDFMYDDDELARLASINQSINQQWWAWKTNGGSIGIRTHRSLIDGPAHAACRFQILGAQSHRDGAR